MKLKNQFVKRSTAGVAGLLQKKETQLDKGLVASYNISLLIAKSAKPHSIGETLILPAAKEIVTTVAGCSTNILSVVPLSKSPVLRRIKEMPEQVEDTLGAELRMTEFSSS